MFLLIGLFTNRMKLKFDGGNTKVQYQFVPATDVSMNETLRRSVSQTVHSLDDIRPKKGTSSRLGTHRSGTHLHGIQTYGTRVLRKIMPFFLGELAQHLFSISPCLYNDNGYVFPSLLAFIFFMWQQICFYPSCLIFVP